MNLAAWMDMSRMLYWLSQWDQMVVGRWGGGRECTGNDYFFMTTYLLGFPGGSVVKDLPANVRHVGLVLGSGRSPGEGNGIPLQYSCLGNATDRGAWQATVHGVTTSQTKLSNQTTVTYLLYYFNWLQQPYNTITIWQISNKELFKKKKITYIKSIALF